MDKIFSYLHTRVPARALAIACMIVVACVFGIWSIADAAVPARTLGFQGQLFNSGAAVDSSVSATFKFYDALSGGSQAGSTISKTVTVSDGYFATSFSESDLSGIDWNQSLWIEVAIEGNTLTPRSAMNAVPFAERAFGTFSYSSAPTVGPAGSLYYNSATGELLVSNGSAWTNIGSSGSATTTLSVGNGFVYTATSTDGVRAAYFTATSTTATSTFAGAVGIGTTTPSDKLDVWGNLRVGTSSTPVLFVDTANRNVGIGTTSFSGAKLSIAGGGILLANPYGISSRHTDGTLATLIQLYSDNNLYVSTNRSGADIIFRAGVEQEALRITASGNVGMGTTTPAAKLWVTGTSGTTTPLFVVASSSNVQMFTVASNGNIGIGSTTPGATLSGPLASTFSIAASSPNQASGAVAGNALSIRAANAVPGSSNVGAANGGSLSFTAGSAAQLTSGSGTGGGLTFTAGVGIGGGASGGMTFTAGSGHSSTASNGGGLTFAAGAASSLGGAGGAISLTAGASGGRSGGSLSLGAGDWSGSGTGGSVILTSGANASGINNGPSGDLILKVGDVTSGNAAVTPGTLTIQGGRANYSYAFNAGPLSSGGAITILTQQGAANTQATGTAGPGGPITTTLGAGSDASGNTNGTGGAGGLYSLMGGAGGNATGAGGIHLGGNGSALTFTSGAGGNATGASGTRTGGNGGNISILTGSGGTGATANGTAGTLSLGVGGVTKLFFSAAGLVGIGTTTPTAALFVQGTGGTNPFAIASSTGMQLFTVTQEGDVGIGTTTPSSLLTLSHASSPEISIYNSTSLKNWRIGSGVGSGSANTTFGIADGSTSRFLIDGSGNIGIGTTSPIAKLSVTGSGAGTGRAFVIADSSNVPRFTVLDNGNLGFGSTTPGATLSGPLAGTFSIAASSPVQGASSASGNALTIRAGDAVPGTSNPGGANGGSLTLTAGNATMLTSGSNNGGSISLIGGTPQSNSGGPQGGSINIIAGSGFNTLGNRTDVGGNVNITGGNTNGDGGNINITGGAQSSGVTGGNITLTSGVGSSLISLVTPAATGNGYTTGAMTFRTGAAIAGPNSNAPFSTGGLTFTTGSAGIYSASSGTGASAGGITYTLGAGGAQSGNTAGTGGNGGSYTVSGGIGGNASGAGGIHTGGRGSTITFISGAGGSATGASGTRTGGNSGSLVLRIGTPGTGATANGVYGNVQIAPTGGDVVIGTSTPWAKLSVQQVFGSTLPLFDIASTTAAYATSSVFRVLSNGNVGIGQSAPVNVLHVGSTAIADATKLLRLQDADSVCEYDANTGAPACASDRTLKKNIVEINGNLEKILALRPVSYNWNTDSEGTEAKIGFIAQEVGLVMPELVQSSTWLDGSTRKFLSTGGMMPYLVGAIKEQHLLIGDSASSTATLSEVTLLVDVAQAETPRSALAYIMERIHSGAKPLLDFVSVRITAIRGYFEEVFAKKVHTDELRTNGLCVGETCITETELKQFLESRNTQSVPVAPSTPPSPATPSPNVSVPITESSEGSDPASVPGPDSTGDTETEAMPDISGVTSGESAQPDQGSGGADTPPPASQEIAPSSPPEIAPAAPQPAPPSAPDPVPSAAL